MPDRYSELEVDRVLATLEALGQRIAERFPEAGLCGVSSELLDVGNSAKAEIERNRHPIWPLRIVIMALIVFMIGGVIIGLANVRVTSDTFHLTNLVDVVQNIIQDFVWLGIGLFFLLRAEDRVKRERVWHTAQAAIDCAHRRHASTDQGSISDLRRRG